MPQPNTGPARLEDAKALIGLTDALDDQQITVLVAAVNALVRGLPVAQLPEPLDGQAVAWPENVTLGANMLVLRLWRRKDNPDGVIAFGDEGAVYVRRNDPDIAMLLKLGAYAPPAVG